MKRFKVIGSVGAVILALSLAANVFLGTQYAKCIEACRHDSFETMRVVRSFEGVCKKVAQIAEGDSINEADLRWLQEYVAHTCFKFQNYAVERGLERCPEEDNIIAKFMDLKDIVFKIEDGNNIPDYILAAIERGGHVEYLKKLSDISRDFLKERENSEAGPNDGAEFWEYYLSRR